LLPETGRPGRELRLDSEKAHSSLRISAISEGWGEGKKKEGGVLRATATKLHARQGKNSSHVQSACSACSRILLLLPRKREKKDFRQLDMSRGGKKIQFLITAPRRREGCSTVFVQRGEKKKFIDNRKHPGRKGEKRWITICTRQTRCDAGTKKGAR